VRVGRGRTVVDMFLDGMTCDHWRCYRGGLMGGIVEDLWEGSTGAGVDCFLL